jgi:alpha-1,2-mannosyltransferase
MCLVHRLDGFGDRLRASARPWEVVCFFWVPGIALGYACWYMLGHGALGDFDIFRRAAVSVLHGRSPYVHPSAAALAHFNKFVYPPVAGVLFSPFAAFPTGVGRALMFVAGVAAVIGAIRLLRVEDWRCYGVALVSAPAVNSLGVGALTSFLLLGVALAWRHRDTAWVSAVATAVTAVLKLFLWPLAVWLLVTRRWRAAAVCAGVALVLLLGGWAVIGFAGMRSYPTLVHVLEQVEAPASYSVIALLGLSGTAATAATVVLSLASVAAIWLAARTAGGDRRAFAVAVVASLVATPLLWLHYLLLIYVPIGLYRPRLSALWFVPLVLWATPSTHSHGVTWQILLALGVLAMVAVRTVFDGAGLSRAGAVPRPAAS